MFGNVYSLGEHEIEMGLGIHGEPGAYKRSMATADELVREVKQLNINPSLISCSPLVDMILLLHIECKQ